MSLSDQFKNHLDRTPDIHPTAYVAPGAAVMGDVTLHEDSSVWFNCTLRGDINRIVVGPGSNIQDNSVVHLADDFGALIGSHVTCGHRTLIHACTIGDEVLVGMGAIIMDGAVVGERSIIGAHALVTQHTVIPPGSMVLGSPAKVVRTLDTKEQKGVRKWAEKYVKVSRRFLKRPPTIWMPSASTTRRSTAR